MAQGQASDFSWFTTWLYDRLAVCVTFARGRSLDQMLAALGLQAHRAAEETFDEADVDLNRPKVRVGTYEGWGYAVEHFTSRGSDPETLCRLSADGGEALALSYMQTIHLFMYAAYGELVNSFDLIAHHIRHGSDPHRFDATMAQAGFFAPGVPDPRVTGPRFVQLTFGITLKQELLGRRLPSVALDLPPPAPPAMPDRHLVKPIIIKPLPPRR